MRRVNSLKLFDWLQTLSSNIFDFYLAFLSPVQRKIATDSLGVDKRITIVCQISGKMDIVQDWCELQKLLLFSRRMTVVHWPIQHRLALNFAVPIRREKRGTDSR